jgi:hypothetical protein
MSTIRQFAGRVRWRWVLPGVMTALTAALIVLMAFESAAPNPTSACDGCYREQPPAFVIATLLSGPAFFWGHLLVSVPPIEVLGHEIHDFGRLAFVPALWFVLGVIAEKKVRHESFLPPRWLKAILLGIGLAASAYVGFMGIRSIDSHIWTDPIAAMRIYRHLKLWGPDLYNFALLIWALIGLFVFSRQMVRVVRRSDLENIANDQLLTTIY